MDYKKRIEEIKEFIWDTWEHGEVSSKEFESLLNEVDDIYRRTGNKECEWLKSEMYMQRAVYYKRKASGKALEVLEDDPYNAGLHDNFSMNAGGAIVDFSKINHRTVIEYYYTFIDKHPDSFIARRILIENLISSYRLDEAEEIIKESYQYSDDKSLFLDCYKGEVLYKKGLFNDALALFDEICIKNSDKFISYYITAESLANFGLFDKALIKYKRAASLLKKPRRIDTYISMKEIYLIKKEYNNAILILDKILEIYKEDYGVVEGYEIKVYSDEREEIENRIR